MVLVTVTKNIDNYTIYYYQDKEYEAEILIYFAHDYSNEYKILEQPSFINIDGQKVGTFL
jgi:hypothetical protein